MAACRCLRRSQPFVTQINARDTAQNAASTGHACFSKSIIHVPPERGLSGWNSTGCRARRALCHPVPVNDTCQPSLVPNESWALCRRSQSAGGPTLFVTQAVISFVPGCSSPATSVLDGDFQFWPERVMPTSRPLMATAASLNAQTVSVALAGRAVNVKECRKWAVMGLISCMLAPARLG